ncbi:protein ninH [Escherichia coli]
MANLRKEARGRECQVPELLIQTRGNHTEVARMLSCARGTVLKYNRDSKGERHVIVNGVLMVKQGKRGRR